VLGPGGPTGVDRRIRRTYLSGTDHPERRPAVPIARRSLRLATAFLAAALLLAPARPAPAIAPMLPRLEVVYAVPGAGRELRRQRKATVSALEARLAAAGARAIVDRPAPDRVRVVIPESDAAEELLTRLGGVSVRLVDDGEATFAAFGPLPAGVSVESWPGLAGRIYRELVAADRSAVEAAVAGRLPADRTLGLAPEYVPEEAGLRWRGVVLFAGGGFEADAIRATEVQTDAATGEQRVLVTLDDGGAKALEQLTAGHVGDRLAVIVDDEVGHTPKIREAIRGGQLAASRCAWRLRPDAASLAGAYAAVLRWPLPPGVTIVRVRHLPGGSG
jgi:hypothetical protein